MPASRLLITACLALFTAGCAAQDGGGAGGFSNCYVREINEQLRYCLAGDTEEDDDFYRVQGRHQIIYGRFNNLPSMTKDGVSYCMTGKDGQSLVNACTPNEVMELATEMLPPAEGSRCEAVMDPRKSLAGC